MDEQARRHRSVVGPGSNDGVWMISTLRELIAQIGRRFMQSRYYRTRPAHAPNGPESPELVTAVQSLGDLVLSWKMPLIVTRNPPLTLHGSPHLLPSSTTIINPPTFCFHYSRAVLGGDNATLPRR